MLSQRRKSTRRRALLAAKLVTPAGVTDCLVNDISDTGAKLQFRSPQRDLPRIVQLRLGEEAHPRFCLVRWVAGLHIGVAFENARNGLLDAEALQGRLARMRDGAHA